MKFRSRSLAMVLLALMASCGGESRALNETIIELGTLGNFSTESTAATGLVPAIELAIDEYNRSRESSYRARLLRADTKGTPEGIAEAVQSLIAAELLFGVVGPFDGGEVLSAGPLLNGASVPFLVPNIPDMSLQSGWTSFRRLVANDRQEGIELGRLAIRIAGDGSIVVLFDSSPQGSAAAEGAKSAIEEQQKAPARFEQVADPNRSADAVMGDNPASVIFAGSAELAGQLNAALGQRGFDGDFIATHQAREPAFVQSSGEHVEGTISSCVCSESTDPLARDFMTAYRERYATAAPPFSLETYDATWMLLEAIEEVAPRPQEIRDFFRTSREFLGDGKRYRFDDGGELIDPGVSVKQFRSGRWLALSPSTARQSE